MSRFQFVNAAFFCIASVYILVLGSAVVAKPAVPLSVGGAEVVEASGYLTASNRFLLSDATPQPFATMADGSSVAVPTAQTVLTSSNHFRILPANATGPSTKSPQNDDAAAFHTSEETGNGAAMVSWPFLIFSALVALLLWSTQRRDRRAAA